MGQIYSKKTRTKTKTEISWEAATFYSFKHFQDQAKRISPIHIHLLAAEDTHIRIDISYRFPYQNLPCTAFCISILAPYFWTGIWSLLFLIGWFFEPANRQAYQMLPSRRRYGSWAACTVLQNCLRCVCCLAGHVELRVCFAWQGGVEDHHAMHSYVAGHFLSWILLIDSC